MAVLFFALLLFTAAPPCTASPHIELVVPVDGGVLRGFDRHGQYARGHTGIDFSAVRGSAVRSAASGRVVFAGTVAGNTSITILHDGNWLTTYSYLHEVHVNKGDEVPSGREIGLSGSGHFPGAEGIHFSLRLEGEYRDPAPFFFYTPVHLSKPPVKRNTRARVRGLIPGFRLNFGAASVAESSARLGRGFLELALAGADWTSRAVNAASSFVSEMVDKARLGSLGLANGVLRIAAESGALIASMVAAFDPALARKVNERARAAGKAVNQRAIVWLDSKSAAAMEVVGRRHEQLARKARVFERLSAFQESQRNCVSSEVPKSGEPDDAPVVVLVGGFGSSLQAGGLPFEIDLGSAGILQRNALAFSYSGFIPASGSGLPVPVDYRPVDTWRGIEVASRLLIQFLAEVRRRFPRRQVAIVAHSQGGVVARKALVDSGGNLTPPPLADRLVTIGSPHQGSRIANRIAALKDTHLGADAVAAVSSATAMGGTSQSLKDLAYGSEVMRNLGSRLPPGIPVTSIAASEDLVVPATQSWLRGADNVLISTQRPGMSAHSGQLRDARTMRALKLALNGDVPCQSLEQWAASDKKSELIDEAIGGFGDFAVDIVRSADPP